MIIDPVVPFWIILVIPLLTALFVYQEWKKHHSFRALRIFSIVLMMLSISGILLHPKYQTKKSSSVVLLTEGYSKEKADSILESDTFTFMHLENIKPYKNSRSLSYADLPHYDNQIKVVLGEGMPLSELDRMDNKNFRFFPSTSPTGITELHVPEAVANRRNSVFGIVNNNEGRKLSIYLEGPGGKEDSIQISGGIVNFELTFVPKQSGNYLYTLSVQDSARTYQEILPVMVTEERSLRILFLQHYPSFELQYLKRYLARKGHRMVLRYQLSKNKFRYEYVNVDPMLVDRLTNGLLEKFDMVITDSNVLSTLSLAEKNILGNSVQRGLGLLNLSFTGQKPNSFFPFQITSVKMDTALLQIASRLFSFPAPRFRVRDNITINPVQKNKTGLLSGYSFQGAGKIGFQLIQETYRLVLSGDSVAYGEIWSPLLGSISKNRVENSKIKIHTPFPWYQDDPIDIQIISSSEEVTLYSDSIMLPLLEDATIDNVWSTRTWAGEPGWHRLETEDGASLNYYVSDTTGWRSLSLANQLNANRAMQRTGVGGLQKAVAWKEVSPLLFYLIFIFSAGFIWVAPKVSRR